MAVPGLVPDAIFFAMLADKIFPIGNFIRRFDQLDYLDEPDLFHDIFGHVPMLSHPGMARMMEHVGNWGLPRSTGAWRTGRAHLLAQRRIRADPRRRGDRIFGAGLASSFGEQGIALDGEAVERRRFTVAAAAATPYDNDRMQPLYFVSDGVEEVASAICGLHPADLAALAFSGYAPISTSEPTWVMP